MVARALTIRAVLQQQARFRIVARAERHDRMKERRVAAEAVSVDRRASIDVGALSSSHAGDFELVVLDGEMEQRGPGDRRDMQAVAGLQVRAREERSPLR